MVQNFTSLMRQVFEVPASSVTILDFPEDYYSAILAAIGSARNRLHIATLYVGTGDKERKMVHFIGEKVSLLERLRSQTDVRRRFFNDLWFSPRVVRSWCLFRMRVCEQACPSLEMYLFVVLGFRKVFLGRSLRILAHDFEPVLSDSAES